MESRVILREPLMADRAAPHKLIPPAFSSAVAHFLSCCFSCQHP